MSKRRNRRSIITAMNRRQRVAFLNPCVRADQRLDPRYRGSASQNNSVVSMILTVDLHEKVLDVFPSGQPYWNCSVWVWDIQNVGSPVQVKTEFWSSDVKKGALGAATAHLGRVGDREFTAFDRTDSYVMWRRGVSSREENWLLEHFPDAPCFS